MNIKTGTQNVTDMEIFIRTVRLGSLSAAARSLDVTPAAISYRLAKLERGLGTRLLHRTTRQLTLTQDGSEYLRWAEQAVAELHKVEFAVSRRNEIPQGTLKVAVPSSFGRQFIAPLMPEFLEQYPLVRINLVMDDEMADIVGQGIDLAIRICKMKDSEFIARKLAQDQRVLCASPRYLKRYGIPETPAELADHNCLVLSQQPFWIIQYPHGTQRMKVAGNFECNNGEVLRELAISGLGIALKATWDVRGAINAGLLQVVLPDYPVLSDTSIWAVYPSRRNVPAKVTMFVSFLKERFDSIWPDQSHTGIY